MCKIPRAAKLSALDVCPTVGSGIYGTRVFGFDPDCTARNGCSSSVLSLIKCNLHNVSLESLGDNLIQIRTF
jgi:hypothetical protein